MTVEIHNVALACVALYVSKSLVVQLFPQHELINYVLNLIHCLLSSPHNAIKESKQELDRGAQQHISIYSWFCDS